METAETQKEQMEVAQMRFGVIAPLVQGTYTDASMAAYCRRVAQTPQRLPDGRVFQYKPKTVAKWYQLYEKGGMEALVPHSELTNGRMAIYISHRLASTRFCDRIILIAEGSIDEEGTHDELINRNRHYADLFDIQSRYYREGGAASNEKEQIPCFF